MPTFPSRQFYLSKIVGTGAPASGTGHNAVAADPWRPAAWDECVGDKSCIHIEGRGSWVLGTTPVASCFIRAMVTSAEHLTIIGDSNNSWLGVGEDVISELLTTAQIATMNTVAPPHIPSWVALSGPMTVIQILEATAAQVDTRTPPGNSWWGYA